MPVLSRMTRFLTLASAAVLAGGVSGCLSMPTGYTYHADVYRAPPGKEAERPTHGGQRGVVVPKKANDVVVEESVVVSMPETTSVYVETPYVDAPVEYRTIYDTSSVEVNMPGASVYETTTYEVLPPGFTPVDMDALTRVADGLLNRLSVNFGRMTEPTRISPPKHLTNRDAAMEIALRRAMEQRGMPVATGYGYGPFTLTYAVHDRAAYAGRYVLDAEIALIVQGKEITRQTDSVTVSAAPMTLSGAN